MQVLVRVWSTCVKDRGSQSRQGMLDDMELGTKQGINPHPFTLRALKPELLMVLRHVGMDLLPTTVGASFG